MAMLKRGSAGIWSAGSDQTGSGIWELQLDLGRVMIVRVQDCLVRLALVLPRLVKLALLLISIGQGWSD